MVELTLENIPLPAEVAVSEFRSKNLGKAVIANTDKITITMMSSTKVKPESLVVLMTYKSRNNFVYIKIDRNFKA